MYVYFSIKCCKMVWKFCEIWIFSWELPSRWTEFCAILSHCARYGMYATSVELPAKRHFSVYMCSDQYTLRKKISGTCFYLVTFRATALIRGKSLDNLFLFLICVCFIRRKRSTIHHGNSSFFSQNGFHAKLSSDVTIASTCYRYEHALFYARAIEKNNLY